MSNETMILLFSLFTVISINLNNANREIEELIEDMKDKG